MSERATGDQESMPAESKITSRNDAERIAMAYLVRLNGSKEIDPDLAAWVRVTDDKANIRLDYGKSVNEPAWYIFAPWCDGRDDTMLRSSRIVAVSKRGGRVLYDGSANDEG